MLMYPDHLQNWFDLPHFVGHFELLKLVKFEVSRHFLRMHGRSGLKFGLGIYSDHPQNLWDFGHGHKLWRNFDSMKWDKCANSYPPSWHHVSGLKSRLFFLIKRGKSVASGREGIVTTLCIELYFFLFYNSWKLIGLCVRSYTSGLLHWHWKPCDRLSTYEHPTRALSITEHKKWTSIFQCSIAGVQSD